VTDTVEVKLKLKHTQGLGETHAVGETSGIESTTHEPAEIPEDSLRWCFEVLTAAAPESPPFDLCRPPPIAPDTLERLKTGIATIPPLPEIWHRVRQMMETDEASPHDLARLIEQDPVLSSHVLQWGNSAVYAPSGTHVSTDVGVILARMGMDEAQNLILESLLPTLGEMDEKSSIQAQHIWFHSKAIAMFCRQLAGFSSHIVEHHAGLVGLLHDIGKLIILHMEDEASLDRIASSIAAGEPDVLAEWQVLGYTHIDAGMMLALHWHLPREVHHFIYFHHHASWHALKDWPHDQHDTVMLVHAAHMMLHSMRKTAAAEGIWDKTERTRLDETETVLRHHLHIPLTDTALYSHMQCELERLERLFPKLYPSPEKT